MGEIEVDKTNVDYMFYISIFNTLVFMCILLHIFTRTKSMRVHVESPQEKEERRQRELARREAAQKQKLSSKQREEARLKDSKLTVQRTADKFKRTARQMTFRGSNFDSVGVQQT